jgi:tRNA(Ile)-lysidine synthase TilS/MesJ
VLSQRYSGLSLCRRHLKEDVEAKARREIRAEGGIRPGDRMAVTFSGGPQGAALARFLLRTFGERRDTSLLALGLPGEAPGMETAARSLGLEWIPVPGGDAGESPAAAAARAGATVLVCPDCLDDLAGRVLARVMEGKVPEGGRRPAPRTLTPFRRIPREEIRLYAEGIGVPWEEVPSREPRDGREELAAALLADHEARHPSAPHALLRLWDSLEGSGRGETD